MTDETTEYQDAVNYRTMRESGDLKNTDFILGSKYIKLLDYFDMVNESCSMMSDDYTLLRHDYRELKQERDILFDAHSKETTRADIADATIEKLCDALDEASNYIPDIILDELQKPFDGEAVRNKCRNIAQQCRAELKKDD